MKRHIIICGVVGVTLLASSIPRNNNGLVKADFGLSLLGGIAASVIGKSIYDGFFRDPVNNEAARHSWDSRDRMCAAAYPTYDPGTGIYRDKFGHKHICPYIK